LMANVDDLGDVLSSSADQKSGGSL
jgi:hypothetical protein